MTDPIVVGVRNVYAPRTADGDTRGAVQAGAGGGSAVAAKPARCGARDRVDIAAYGKLPNYVVLAVRDQYGGARGVHPHAVIDIANFSAGGGAAAAEAPRAIPGNGRDIPRGTAYFANPVILSIGDVYVPRAVHGHPAGGIQLCAGRRTAIAGIPAQFVKSRDCADRACGKNQLPDEAVP